MRSSRFIRGLTWLAVAAIMLSAASPALASQVYANSEGIHSVAASAQAGDVALQDFDPPIPVASPAPAWPEVAAWQRPQYVADMAPAVAPRGRTVPQVAALWLPEVAPLPLPDLPVAGLPPITSTLTLVPDMHEAEFPHLPLILRGEAGVFTQTVQVQLAILPSETASDISPVGVAFSLRFQAIGRSEAIAPQPGKSLQLIVEYGQIGLPQFGGSFSSRLVLQRATDCDLSTEPMKGSTLICGKLAGLPVQNDLAQQRLVVELNAPLRSDFAVNQLQPTASITTSNESTGSPATTSSSVAFYVLTSSGSGSEGDYSATPLTNVADYQVGLFSGAAQTGYTVPLPPAAAGPAPQVQLAYDSGQVDRMASDKNNQPDWVGLGWSLEQGYIVHHLKPCGQQGSTWRDDLCPTNEYSIVLNGRMSRLISAGGELYHLQDDPYWRVERKVSSQPDHPDWQRYYWLVTTPDGIQYRFGGEFDPETGENQQSVFWTPLYGLCGSAPNYDTLCNWAWRWNLDRVEDTNGNVISFYYQRETNFYAAAGHTEPGPYRREYVRGGWLDRIDYTRRAGQTGTAPVRVQFTAQERCTPGSACAWPADYPDTPGDLACTSSGSCTEKTPTFWTRKLLDYVETQVWDTSASAWRNVARYDLDYSYPAPPADEQGNVGERKLWLSSITQRPGGGGVGLPPAQYGYVMLANRRGLSYQYVPPMYLPRLQTITTELGGQITFTYDTPNLCPAQYLSFPDTYVRQPYDCFAALDKAFASQWGLWRKYKVVQVEVRDSFSGNDVQTTSYSYSTPLWHHNDDPWLDYHIWNDFRGHEMVTVTDGSQAKTEYRFQRGMHGDRISAGNPSGITANVTLSDGSIRPDYNWLRGSVVEVRRLKSDTTAVSRGVNWYTWTLTAGSGDNGAYFVEQQKTEETRYGTNPKTTRVEYVYDSYGNVQREILHGDTATGDDDRNVERSYVTNTAAWIIDRPQWEKLWSGVDSGSAGQELGYTAYAYDNQATGAAPTAGNLTLLRRFYQATPSYLFYDTTTAYDTWGRPTSVTDANNHTTTTAYHSFYGYTQSVTNALGHVATYIVDPGWGVATTIIDPNNRSTTLQYDSFGRQVKVWLPTEATNGPASLEYVYGPEYRPALVQSRQLSVAASSTYRESWTYYDGLGRTLQTQRASVESGKRVLSSLRYNNLGQLQHDGPAYQIDGAAGSGYVAPDWLSLPNYHYYSYDELGNRWLAETKSYSSVIWSDVTIFDAWQLRSYDPNGQRRDTYKDAFGQTVQVDEFNAGNATYTTLYAYDRTGGLVQVSDAANNVTSMSYDLLGRKTVMNDPDMGTWQYSYDGVGNMTAQKDGRNLWLYFEYDVLNRLVKKRQDSGTGPIIAEYLFDATGQKGLLSRSKAYTAQGTVEVYSVTYDARNRLTQQNWIVPGTGGGTFRLDNTYNAADQQATLRYPGGTAGQQGELVTTGYNTVGQVNSVSGSGVSYVSSTTYNARGQVTEQRLDTGSNGLTRQYVYESNTLRLSTARAGVASPYTNLQNLTYSYDNVGNVTSIVDGVNSNQRQCFQYDWLHRLTGAFSGNAGCTAYSATGNYPYNHTYGYNAIGNITSYAGTSYTYGAGKPHAVSAAYGNTYGYDGNGNQTTRTISGVTYTQVFDYENRLTEVKQGATSLATFLYDADGNRVKGAVSGTTTVYIAGIYEQQGAAYTSYYEGGGLRRSGYSTNNGVFYMLGDHLKSTSALVARNGVLNIKYFYFPYGARRGLTFNTITAKHFTGQYHETSLPGGEGLYNFGARWFDPKLARFVSADTIVPDPGVPQSLNRYAYAIGNPLRYTDPSGHMFCEDCTGGAGHYGGGRTGGTGPSRGGGTSSTPTSTPPGCYSVVCLPTSTPTHTPTDTPRPGPGYYPTTPTPTPTPTATPWPYTRTPGRVNVPDLYWGTAYALTVSLPKAVGNPTILHAVGRGAPETLGGPISAMVGLAVSVYPNEIRHVTQGDSVRETVTDVIVDTGGYAFSTIVGTGGAAGAFGAAMLATQGQVEIAAPIAVFGDIVASAGASLLWDLWASPNYVRPFVYQHLPD